MAKATQSLVALLTLVMLTFAANLHAFEFELGAGLSKTVVRASEKASQNNTAVISNPTSGVPYFAISGDEYYPLEDFSLGISWQFWGSPYQVNKQEIRVEKNGTQTTEERSVGTRLSGLYFYGLPLVYYRIGDKNDETVKNYRISLGIGYGISYVTMNGSIRMTRDTEGNEIPVAKAPKENIQAEQFYYAVGIFARVEYQKYFIQVSTYTPQITSGDHVYRISNVSWVIGRKFHIDFDIDDYL